MLGLGGRLVEVDAVAQRRGRDRKFTYRRLGLVWRRILIRLRQRRSRKRGEYKQERETQGGDRSRERP